MTQDEIIHRDDILSKVHTNKSFPYAVGCSRFYMMNTNNSRHYIYKLIPSRNEKRYSSEKEYLTIHAANKLWSLIVV